MLVEAARAASTAARRRAARARAAAASRVAASVALATASPAFARSFVRCRELAEWRADGVLDFHRCISAMMAAQGTRCEHEGLSTRFGTRVATAY